MQITLSVELEKRVQERLSSGVDPDELMEVALLALSERDAVQEAVKKGWRQADSGEFANTSVTSVMQRASR